MLLDSAVVHDSGLNPLSSCHLLVAHSFTVRESQEALVLRQRQREAAPARQKLRRMIYNIHLRVQLTSFQAWVPYKQSQLVEAIEVSADPSLVELPSFHTFCHDRSPWKGRGNTGTQRVTVS